MSDFLGKEFFENCARAATGIGIVVKGELYFFGENENIVIYDACYETGEMVQVAVSKKGEGMTLIFAPGSGSFDGKFNDDIKEITDKMAPYILEE